MEGHAVPESGQTSEETLGRPSNQETL
jgi:hypothetical protein